MALPAEAGENISVQRHLVRHRQQRDARRSEPDLRAVQLIFFCCCHPERSEWTSEHFWARPAPKWSEMFLPPLRDQHDRKRGARAFLLQSSFVELDEVEVGLNVFPAGAPGFFQEMGEARFLGGGIGVARNHGGIP